MTRIDMRALLVAGALLGCGAARAASFTYTSIQVPGTSETFAVGLNAHGVVVGDYGNSDGRTGHGFIFSGGQYQTLDPPGSLNTFISGISDDGTVFGSFQRNLGVPAVDAFTYKSGVFTIFGKPGDSTQLQSVSRGGLGAGTSTDLRTSRQKLFYERGGVTQRIAVTSSSCGFNGVNDSGVSTGICMLPGGNNKQPFINQAGHFTRIVIPSGSQIQPYGINNTGTVVGGYFDSRRAAMQGFIDKAGAITVVQDANRRRTYLQDVNDAGDAVGVGYTDISGTDSEAFQLHGKVMTYLQPPGAFAGTILATAINASGQALGSYKVGGLTGPVLGFLATPAPSP